MQFSERQELLLRYFDPSAAFNRIEGTPVDIYFQPFDSLQSQDTLESRSLTRMREAIPGAGMDESILQNKHFNYPVFLPVNMKSKRVIIMLHGLNERKWDKYLAWAHYLAEETGKAVILFPTSFHLNRSLPIWTDPHSMNELAVVRRKNFQVDPHFSTFVNLALSERLTEMPQRFFLSGLQTSVDLTSLLTLLKSGEHPLLGKAGGFDFFAYSIGGLLAQVMFISDPGGMLWDSRLFLFCAGSLFSQMNGISRVIIDPLANERIQNYYRNELEEDIKKSGIFSEFFNESRTGMAFRSMIAPDRFRKIRERVFSRKQRQIMAVALKDDMVIPPAAIGETLMGKKGKLPGNMEVYDFGFLYSHEIPFPFKVKNVRNLVDEAFEKIFRKAALFLG